MVKRAALAFALVCGGCTLITGAERADNVGDPIDLLRVTSDFSSGLPDLAPPPADLPNQPFDLAGGDLAGGAFIPEASGTTATLRALWAFGGHITAVGDTGTIVHSIGDGVWNLEASGTTKHLRGIASAAVAGTYAVGDGGTILKFDSVSKTWKAMITGFVDNFTAASGGSNVVVVCSAQGTVVEFPSMTTAIYSADILNGADNHGTGALWIVGDQGRIRFGALGANQEQSNTLQRLNGVWVVSSSLIHAVGAGGTVLRSAGDGTWFPVASATTQSLNAVWSDGIDVWVVGANGTILRSASGGAFKPVPSGTSASLNGVFGSNGVVYVVGANGTILRSP